MKVALHSIPEGFFKTPPPHNDDQLFRLIKKASSLGFKYFQVGPFRKDRFSQIDGKHLKPVLDTYGMGRTVHIGGLYDAEKFALTEQEYVRAQKEIDYGIKLCSEIDSSLMSFHPPYKFPFTINESTLSKARERFLELVNNGVESAHREGIKLALESYCYTPFIFNGLHDFMHFVSHFPSTKLGVLLDVGHLYNAKFDLDEAIRTFKDRLLDVHVHDAFHYTVQEDLKKATHLPLGKGDINFSLLLSTLSEANYNGCLSLEIRDTEQEIVKSKQYLENLIKTTPM